MNSAVDHSVLIRRQRKEKETDDLARQISRFVNGSDQEEIANLAGKILNDHRTLQQKTFGLFLECIRKWAALEPQRWDSRNDFTVGTCKKIMERVEEAQYQPPLI